ncbi:MAG: helix-turn-helix domain-containing protein [Candidatus Jordarchaeum sp.]|uniref:helix-turn-helix domain-containing protein n=1 Tax=Candidatus Jordarchaeum sp. TaxID=2823881 RepID=UPI004049F7B5
MGAWEETLKDIGITGNQAKVYATCVGLGAKTASELAVYTGLNIPEVSQELETLQSMGVIKKIPGKIDFYIALTPRIALTGIVAETLKNKLENLKNNIMESAEGAIQSLSQNMESFKTKLDENLSNYLKETKDSSNQMVVQLLESTKEILEGFQSEASQLSQSIEQYLQQMLSDHDKNSRETIKILVEQANQSVGTFRSDIKDIKETAQNVLGDFIEQTRITINEFQEKLESAVNDTVKTIESRTSDVSGRSTSEVNSLFSDLDYAFDQSIKEVREISLQPLTTINENAIKIAETAMSGISEFMEELEPLTETHITKIQSMNEALLMDFRKNLETNRKKLVEFIKEIEETIKTQTIKLRDSILEESKEVNSKVKEFLNHSRSEISRVMKSYKDRTTEIVETLEKAMEEFDSQSNFIIESFDKARSDVEEKLMAVSQQVKTNLEGSQEELKISLGQLRENFEKKTMEWEESLSTRKTIDSDALREQLENIERFVFEQETPLKTSLEEELQKAEKELKTKVTEIVEESNILRQRIQSRKENALETSRNRVEPLLSKISESNKNLIDNLNDSLERRTQLTKKHLEDFVSNFNSESGSLKNNLSVNFTDSIAVQKSRVNSFEETFTTALSKMIDILQFIEDKGGDKKKFSLGKEETEELLDRVTFSKKEIIKLKNELKKSVNDLNENFSMVSTNILDELDRSLTYIGESFEKKTGKTIQSLLDEDVKTREALGQKIENTFENTITPEITNFKTINENNLSEFHSEIDTQIDKQLREIEKIKNDAISHVTSNRDNCLTVFGFIKSGIGEQLAKLSEILQKTMVENYETTIKISSEAQEQLGSLFAKIQDTIRIEPLSEMVKNSIEESIENLKQALENTNTDKQKIINQARDAVNNFIASREEIQKISWKSVAEVEDFAEQISTLTSTLGSQILQQFSEEKVTLKEDLESEINESVNETNKRLENFLASLKESLNSYVEKVIKLKATAEKDVHSKLDQEFAVLKKQLMEQKEQLGETLVKKRDEINEKQGKLQKGVLEVVSALGQELPSYVEKIKYDLLSTLDRHSRESRDSAEVKLESLVGITDKPFANLESKLLDFDRELSLSFEKLHSELKSKTYETLESLKDDHTAFEETINNQYTNMEKALKQKLEEATSSHLKEISKTITMTKISSEETERDVTLALNTFTEDIAEKIIEAITNTQETLKLITRIMKLSEEIEPKPFEDTERVVGKEQILNLLKTLIRNTKSTITILTPTIQDVPIEDLTHIPRQRVILITDAEGKAPPMPAHIQLKHNPGNIYAFNRDSEEMILAVATPEPLGVYTTNMELIKLLNQILQDVSSRAKKI